MSNSKAELVISDFLIFPVWRYDPDKETFEPLVDIDTPIGSIDELHFYARFTTRIGQNFQGSVTGKGDIAIGIFLNDRWYSLNNDWKQASLEQLGALIRDSNMQAVSSPTELLPLRFETIINKKPFVDWSGEFDLQQ